MPPYGPVVRIRALLIALAVLLVPAFAPAALAAADDDGAEVELVIFHRDGCPHCARALDWLEGLQADYPDLRISRYEVSGSQANRDLFVTMATAHGFEPQAVPTMFLGDLYWVGFDSTVAEQIEAAVATRSAGSTPVQEERTTVDVPFVGQVDIGHSSLLVSTVVIGFADGLNPCSFWVLSVLFALVLRSGSRRRVLAVGVTFLAVTSALYGLYMFGAYSALEYADRMTWVRVLVALVAGTFGVLHVKEYVTHAGPSITLSDRRKPGMYRSMRSLAAADKALPAVLGGTAALAAGVSLAETPCTAGLPLMWTNLLADADVSGLGTALLFAVYLAVFLLDELAVFALAVVSLRAVKLDEGKARALQLLSGTLMLALAATMLFAPDLMTSLGGTLVVFGVAALVVAVELAAEHHWRRRHPATRRPAVRRGTRQSSAAHRPRATKHALRTR